MLAAYRNHDLSAMAGLTTVPKNISDISETQIHSLKLNAATMVFFKTSSPALADVSVRRALIQAIDQTAVLKQLDYATRPVKSPFLQGQVGYNATYNQAAFNPEQAKAGLAAAGYVAGPAGILQKGDQKLIFDLYTDDNAEYTKVAQYLSKEWRKLGIVARVNALPAEDLKNTLAGHTYDAVLHVISIGTDPDVFVYWDSSQTDIRSVNRLNFSEYKSSAADASLQAGRSTVDNALRVVKYQPFLKNWQQDAPALGLYQPRYIYVTRGEVYGLSERSINASVDRLSNVDNWMIRTGGITN
jgi:peptide/nickel transport system substrate-binding protein